MIPSPSQPNKLSTAAKSIKEFAADSLEWVDYNFVPSQRTIQIIASMLGLGTCTLLYFLISNDTTPKELLAGLAAINMLCTYIIVMGPRRW